MGTEFLQLWLAALLFAIGLMTLIWWLAVRIGNAGIVDIAWSAGFAPIVVGYAAAGSGALARRLLIASMVSVWSVRLAAYLYVRVSAQHPLKDRRYARLCNEWGLNANRKMFGFFQLQAGLLALLSVPWLLTCLNSRAGLQPIEWAGGALWLIAISGEALADHQLQRFKADPAHRGALCQAGLWRYSRHPNYFFEWLVWVAYFLVALASPWGWVSIYCPALMLYFLLRVTGIPLTEQLSAHRYGAAFTDYQRRTSAFVPWLPKRG